MTTATDAAGLPGLDTLGWPVDGAVAAVSRAMLDGEPVALRAQDTWPLPPLPVGDDGEHVLAVTDRVDATPAAQTAYLRPPSLVLGVGASRGVSADEVLALVDRVLADAGLAPGSVAEVATVDEKADEAGIVEACARRGWPLTTLPAAVLAEVDVPNPSEEPRKVLGTPSVAEAAALAHSGGDLVVEKAKSAMATVAVARRRPRGRLALVGLGPGARDLLTPRAKDELRRASVWVGLDQYVDQVRDLARPGTRFVETGLGKEEERAHSAVQLAQQGHAVALVGSGDAGVYAMASPALEFAGDDIDVVGVPGVTAALAASNLLGAPLGHDHASISLSDLHTPWPAIEARVRAAAEGDLVVTFYNPRSRGRDWQLPKAVAMLLEHRPATTPVGIVTDASPADRAGRPHDPRRARRDRGHDVRVRRRRVVAEHGGGRAVRDAAGLPVGPVGGRPVTYVFTDDCTACGACLLTCPEHAIVVGVPLQVREDRCTSCGECVEVCPADAVLERS